LKSKKSLKMMTFIISKASQFLTNSRGKSSITTRELQSAIEKLPQLVLHLAKHLEQ
jgi:hypothetical protein